MSTAIKVENLSKAYQLGEIGSSTISRDVERWLARIRGKEDPFLKIGETNDRSVKGTSDIVWSLKDINFEINQGDAVGIIGRNGAGKSTLLKILSRVTSPTSGSVKIKGRVASLLEVGTGFHPELTGRENIYLNGAILGMRKKEIARKFDEIVDFSGVERYIDTPVKRYSSGMYVRLAFAVAAHLESEILIVDEVLAVGDAEFQKKCLGKMGDVSTGEGRTVLFVSHNMGSIKALCKQAILIEKGGVIGDDSVEPIISKYYDAISPDIKIGYNLKKQERIHRCVASGKYGGRLLFDSIQILDNDLCKARKLKVNDKLIFNCRFKVFEEIPDLDFHIRFYDADNGQQAAFTKVIFSNVPLAVGVEYTAAIVIDQLELKPGNYLPYIGGFSISDEPYDIVDQVYFDMPILEVIGNEEYLNSIVKMVSRIER